MGGTGDSNTFGHLLQGSIAKRRNFNIDFFNNMTAFSGMEVFLEFETRSGRSKVKTVLVGSDPGKYIIIATPRIEGVPVKLLGSPDSVIIRYLLDGSVFGFESKIVKKVGDPFFLTILDYPKQIEQISLRIEPRITIVLPLSREGGDPTKECLLNFSVKGALLQLQHAVKRDQVFSISFSMPNGKAILDVKCLVKRVEMYHDRILAGVQFQPSSKQVAQLDHFFEVIKTNLGKYVEG